MQNDSKCIVSGDMLNEANDDEYFGNDDEIELSIKKMHSMQLHNNQKIAQTAKRQSPIEERIFDEKSHSLSKGEQSAQSLPWVKNYMKSSGFDIRTSNI